MGRSKLPVVLTRSGEPFFGGAYRFEYGVADWPRSGSDGVIVAMGTVVGAAVDAADALLKEGLEVGVCAVSCPLDVDDESMARVASSPWVLVAEDHGWRTGLWASLAEWAVLHGVPMRAVPLGIDGYQSSGEARELLARAGLDGGSIAARARELSGLPPR
jgi:transketolase